MALLGKKSYLGDIGNNVTGSSSLVSRNSRLDLDNPNPTKYYQTVGTARRKPGSSNIFNTSFGNDAQGTTAGWIDLDQDVYTGYIMSELNENIITEDNNNLITE